MPHVIHPTVIENVIDQTALHQALNFVIPRFFSRLAQAVGIVSAGLLLGGSPAFASHPDVDWGGLNLSSQQSQQINQVEAQWKVTAGQIIPQIKQDKSELLRLLNSPNGDQRRIMELQGRINSNKSRLHNAAMQSYLKKKEYLSPDQQQQLQRMIGPAFH
ncbi:MAG: hypothetical protein VKJ04_01500 [Vampirovibrionales bacterium]|nr:hypothetical protein [Vampirovibrionales bacterium]